MTIRIVIGTEARTEIARKVLEYSILMNTKSEVRFYHFMGEDYYDRGHSGEGTGFSFLRFRVPEYFGYQGKAIYLDADMLVLNNIKKLWDLGQSAVSCVYGNEKLELAETSMMVIDCEKVQGKMKTLQEITDYVKDDPTRKKYREIMKLQYLNPQPTSVSCMWNVMDKGSILTSIKDFTNPKAKLLHFTDVRRQPWFIPEHPHANIWGEWYKRAYQAGYLGHREVIEKAVEKYDLSNPRRPNGLHKKWLKEIS